MGAPIPKIEPVDNSTAEALLSSLQSIDPAERRKHASVFNYWLSIRGDRQFPPIRDLDPLEISDAGPWSLLLEMIGAGENAVIRHLGQAIKLGVDAETIARAPNPSLLACIHDKLPAIASSMQPLAFEDSFETDSSTVNCWVTLLPFSASGSWIDYVYGYVSLDLDGAGTDSGEPEFAEEASPGDLTLEPGQVPLAPMDEDPTLAEVVDAPADAAFDAEQPQPEEPVEEVALEPEVLQTEVEFDAIDQPLEPMAGFESDPDQPSLADLPAEPPSEWEDLDSAAPAELESGPDLANEPDISTGPAKAGFSSKFFESLANVGGFYGRVVHAEPGEPGELIEEPIAEEIAAGQPAVEEMALEEEMLLEEEAPIIQSTCKAEGTLQSKLSEVRAMAEEARQAQLRSQLALHAGLSAAYDFALDAESEPEEYLRLVEGQGLKIQLRSPMKPVVKLAFAESCDDATIAQLEAVLAWALKMDLPRGSLAERIESEGGIGPILEGLGKAA